MDEAIQRALESDTLIDITTTGRRSGQSRRIEIGFSYLDGRIFITGRPGRRGWYANLTARPQFTIHFKQSFQRDVAATAIPMLQSDYRRRIFEQIRERAAGRFSLDVGEWVARSPLVRVEISDPNVPDFLNTEIG